MEEEAMSCEHWTCICTSPLPVCLGPEGLALAAQHGLGLFSSFNKTSARAINLIHTRNYIDNFFMYTKVALFWTHTNENAIEKKS